MSAPLAGARHVDAWPFEPGARPALVTLHVHPSGHGVELVVPAQVAARRRHVPIERVTAAIDLLPRALVEVVVRVVFEAEADDAPRADVRVDAPAPVLLDAWSEDGPWVAGAPSTRTVHGLPRAPPWPEADVWACLFAEVVAAIHVLRAAPEVRAAWRAALVGDGDFDAAALDDDTLAAVVGDATAQRLAARFGVATRADARPGPALMAAIDARWASG